MKHQSGPNPFLRWVFSCAFIFCLLPATAQQRGSGQARISIPGTKGVLEVNVGPSDWEARVRPDGKETQLQAMNRPDLVMISAFLQRVNFPASPAKCREEWWPGTEKGDRARFGKLDDLNQNDRDGIARVEFIIPEYEGKKVRMKNMHAYLGSGKLCAEIHLSRLLFKAEDQDLFEAVLKSARLLAEETEEFGAHAPQTETAPQGETKAGRLYFNQGSRLFLEKNYSAAAEQYQKALELEKSNRTLSRDLFRVLIDNLGMSYGISGNLAKAKATFEYGIAQDSEYPLFYYNMACTYGEMGRMQESLAQLRLAYKYRANMIAGEGDVPDPLRDDSFREFVNNAEFVRAVREMQRQ